MSRPVLDGVWTLAADSMNMTLVLSMNLQIKIVGIAIPLPVETTAKGRSRYMWRNDSKQFSRYLRKEVCGSTTK